MVLLRINSAVSRLSSFALLAPRSTSDDEALGWRDAIMGISYTFLNAAELPGKLGYGVKCICLDMQGCIGHFTKW